MGWRTARELLGCRDPAAKRQAPADIETEAGIIELE
jgi:hypothetical protein